LPPGQRTRLPAAQAVAYRRDTEMAPLYTKYQVIPPQPSPNDPPSTDWLTHFPNDPGVPGPDRTIDYLVLSPTLQILDAHVRHHDTEKISDHLPVTATVQLP